MTKELIFGEYKKGDGESTVDFLSQLIKKTPAQKIIIFWDGATYHKGELMREFLSELNTGLDKKDWQVTCHLFAPYAPEENPIEAIWLQLKKLTQTMLSFLQKLFHY